jgi:hypothetical protein
MRRFETIISQYITEEEAFLDNFKTAVAKGEQGKMYDILTIAKKMDKEELYWADWETWLIEEGGISVTLEWYDLVFEATDGKFLTKTRKQLLYEFFKVDTLRMIAERYNLSDWNYRDGFMDFHSDK